MEDEMNEPIKIYPLNWLMTAGIVGFAKIFGQSVFYKINNNDIEIDNVETLKEEFFKQYFPKAREFKIPLKTFYNNSRLSNNRFKNNGETDIDKTNKYFFEDVREGQLLCSFCSQRKAIERKENGDADFSAVQLDEIHFTPLGSSPGNLANLYWEGNPSNFLCLPCELIIYCAAFGFTRVGKRYVFINAPATVQEILEINKIWAEYLKQGSDKSFKDSLIEVLKRMEKTRAKWTLQNISFIELAPLIDKTGKATTTFNIFPFSISPETANAVRKMIQRFPNNLKDIYDIFIDNIYGKKPLYDMVGNIVYGLLNKERLEGIDNRNLQKSATGRLVLSGKYLKNPKDLLFFLKFQKEVEGYEQ